MRVLDIKVMRDVWSMRTQVLSIALLIASGVAIFVMSVSNYQALVSAMDEHYHRERFADLFASLKRAPKSIIPRLREIDGIGIVEPRICKPVRVIRPDTVLPISGRIVSLPASGQPLLNRLHLVEGRSIDPARFDEIIINDAYAKARKVRPGDSVDVILNSRLQSFRVVGTALSPEFVFATRSALPLPDDRNLVILWAGEDAVASAFDMRGAFNDAVFTVEPQASKSRVIEEIDRLLAPYGGVGAFDRSELSSHRFLQDELAEQKTLSIVIPTLFFGIAAFLLNVILGRLVDAQREQIASLKALGFGNTPIIMHYIKFVSLIAVAGSLIGILLGWWLAIAIIESYRGFFRFPVLEARFEAWPIAVAALVSIVAANAAAASAVRRVARLTPAEALRAPVPTVAQHIPFLGQRTALRVPLSAIMALRSIIGRPFRTFFTIAGIALAIPLVLFGLFWFDAIDYMIDVSFSRTERGDAFVSFSGPVPAVAVYELRAIPGVLAAEGQRIMPVQLRNGHRRYRTALYGLGYGTELKVLRNANLEPIAVPLDGLMLSRPLAKTLGLSEGDTVTIEILDGVRPVRDLQVVKLSDDMLGFSATIELTALNRLLGDDDVVNAAALKIDPVQSDAVWRRIQETPKIEESSVKAQWLQLFDETIAGLITVSAFVLTGFGLLIAVGVVYNSARTAFHERAWELASLRILGFTRNEVSWILVSELALEVLVAIPLGLLAGRLLIELMVALRIQESFQIPAIIEPETYAAASLIVFAAALASAFAIRRRINQLDLVTVLKTRE